MIGFNFFRRKPHDGIGQEENNIVRAYFWNKNIKP